MPFSKNENPTIPVSQNGLNFWVCAARPKTLIASMSPVLIGTFLAAKASSIHLSSFFFTFFFALLIQIGTNFANDYFDFFKGADSFLRIGPKRALQQGWITPTAMKWGIFIVFTAAFLCSLPLLWQTSVFGLFLVILSISFGLLYTAGPFPIAYVGLGELFVFPFFGPVAVCGAYFVQTHSISPVVALASLGPAFLSTSLLIANNLRDAESDKAFSKKTLIVRFGKTFGWFEYTASLLGAASIPLWLVLFFDAPLKLLAVSVIFPLFLPTIRKTNTQKLLQTSSILLTLYTILFCALW